MSLQMVNMVNWIKYNCICCCLFIKLINGKNGNYIWVKLIALYFYFTKLNIKNIVNPGPSLGGRHVSRTSKVDMKKCGLYNWRIFPLMSYEDKLSVHQYQYLSNGLKKNCHGISSSYWISFFLQKKITCS